MINQQFPRQILELQKYFSKENRDALVRAIPGEGLDIPMYILGSSTDSAWLAAELGLPYAFAGHFAPEQMEMAFNIYREHFEPSKYLDKPYIIACVNGVAAETSKKHIKFPLLYFRLSLIL
jgi:alkanesulfonate monooxygenase SsuD/methylene tetrahydromethanopterin reductase-like flavin-dependent oxidoreductase (luciferase family)